MKLDKSTKNVEAMFNSIAFRYDFLNHFFSLGIDKLWRRRLVKEIVKTHPARVLDIATGTADLSICLAKRSSTTSITGVDVSANMLEIGNQKLVKSNLHNQVNLIQGSAMNLPFSDSSFSCAMVAFGVRNFDDLKQGISEAYRAIVHGGSLYVLEFTMPTNSVVKALYSIYFRYFLPFLGGKISGNSDAYRYLPESVEQFPQNYDFVKIMQNIGFVDCSFTVLSFGIAAIYVGTKPS